LKFWWKILICPCLVFVFRLEPVISSPSTLLLCPCGYFTMLFTSQVVSDLALTGVYWTVPQLCLAWHQKSKKSPILWRFFFGYMDLFERIRIVNGLASKRGWSCCCWSSAIFFTSFFIMLEAWRWTGIGMGRKDSILYRTL
jgi:hypothetical protein